MKTNTAQSQHTPTPDPRLTPVPQGPFHVDETRAIAGGWETAVRGSDGRRLCTIIERDHMPKESGEIRAAFIVRACNSHAQLVAALEKADEVERLANEMATCRTIAEITARKLYSKLATAQYEYKQARAALAAAKEVQS